MIITVCHFFNKGFYCILYGYLNFSSTHNFRNYSVQGFLVWSFGLSIFMDNGTPSCWKKSRSASEPPDSDFMPYIFRYLDLIPVNGCAALYLSWYLKVEKLCQFHRLNSIKFFRAIYFLIFGGVGMGFLTRYFPSLLCVGEFSSLFSPWIIK